MGVLAQGQRAQLGRCFLSFHFDGFARINGYSSLSRAKLETDKGICIGR